MQMIPYLKYHALGNDYLVLDPVDVGERPAPALVQHLCRRRVGVGADGVVIGPLPGGEGTMAVRVFNPDGSEAEMSGNGLRIFARAVRDRGVAPGPAIGLEVAGRRVSAHVAAEGDLVSLDLGPPSFDSRRVPVVGPTREVLGESWLIAGRRLTVSAVSLGNPHCVVLAMEVSPAWAREMGPVIERDERFPRRANVQFLQVLGRERLRLEIWERGAGYTLASGSSAAAATAVAHRLGLCESEVRVEMPGGALRARVTPDGVTIAGPVVFVGDGRARAGPPAPAPGRSNP